MKDTSSCFYLAPELFGNFLEHQFDKIDVFALGVLIFVTLFKQPPFAKAEVSDKVYLFFVNQTAKFFKWHPALRNQVINPLLQDLLVKMMELNPSKRISLKEALLHPYI